MCEVMSVQSVLVCNLVIANGTNFFGPFDQLRIEPLDSVLKLDTGEFSLCGSIIRPSVRRMARSNSHEPHRVLGYFDSDSVRG